MIRFAGARFIAAVDRCSEQFAFSGMETMENSSTRTLPDTSDIMDSEVHLLRANLADLRAQVARLEGELLARRREVASLHAMLGQVLRGPWVYVEDGAPQRWA